MPASGKYQYIEDNAYQTVSSRYAGERTMLYANGSPVAINRSSGTRGYLGTDILGSTRSVTDNHGVQESYYDYDIFGSPITGNYTTGTDYGYLGKPYDSITGLYNYGYRDYSPQTVRFTTVDPIRDGANWFAYVNNDPVNYVDLWGLCASDSVNKQNLSVKKNSTFRGAWNSWKEKPKGAILTAEESLIQEIAGGVEIVVGFLVMFATGGYGVQTGAFMMADGAIVFSEGQNGEKVRPFEYFTNFFVNPHIDIPESDIDFVSPLP